MFLKGLKEFATRGTIVDMGIGIIIGAAFGKVVSSFVSDIIMPPVGLVLGRVDFSNLYVNLSGGQFRSLAEAQEAGAATINYGVFIETILHFSIIAGAAYFIILQMNRLKRLPKEASQQKTCPYCFSDISQRAVRCPKCTSAIKQNEHEDDIRTDRSLRVTIRQHQ
ncbi:large conductance mechanosensitive channel protein MscL [Alteribacter lacisalsi]|uniref:Large-conductance mechanosensitive channel n=1 Tax=Alteribacter lacisalsi TaxID=2045244 RepID=A0A2W0HHA3_9BACI|nr:large conductance mechanosensitive channel protein MscL [Alteribacter lacisalsi]PYZ96189.1 large conductance mechanosensitive channel protein MscL [Alteribacter lacisalsi]